MGGVFDSDGDVVFVDDQDSWGVVPWGRFLFLVFCEELSGYDWVGCLGQVDGWNE